MLTHTIELGQKWNKMFDVLKNMLSAYFDNAVILKGKRFF